MLIWDDMHRTELSDFLERQRNIALKNADELDLGALAGFEFSALSKELVVGGVFVRVFNDQPRVLKNANLGFVAFSIVQKRSCHKFDF
mgnify:CR=1 FL=1